jgi:hypothetical protein
VTHHTVLIFFTDIDARFQPQLVPHEPLLGVMISKSCFTPREFRIPNRERRGELQTVKEKFFGLITINWKMKQ